MQGWRSSTEAFLGRPLASTWSCLWTISTCLRYGHCNSSALQRRVARSGVTAVVSQHVVVALAGQHNTDTTEPYCVALY